MTLEMTDLYISSEMVEDLKRINKKVKMLGNEIQSWLGSPPKTVSRYKKFYESMISIHLGGEGLMNMFYKELNEGMPPKELKTLYRNYKINYPGREENDN